MIEKYRAHEVSDEAVVAVFNGLRSVRPQKNNKDGDFGVMFDTRPMNGPLKLFQAPTLKLVTSSLLEPLWDELVRTYHFLGYRKLLGHRIKYLAFIDTRPVAALSWSAAARRLRVRDRFIGWDDAQRRRHLHHIASNSRFLILPWVNIPHLASHVLAQNIKRLNRDWTERFGFPLWLLETFVDLSRFQGTVYKAANWTLLGHSAGYAKQGQGYTYHGSIKEVYVYVLEPGFREYIGCKKKPYRFFHRPPLNQEKVEVLKMILRDAQWHPEIEASLAMDEDDVQNMAEELVTFHDQFHSCFKRIEQERLGLGYLSGLLSNCPRKSVEPMALELFGKKEVRSMQRFMKTYRWDQEEMEHTHQTLLADKIASSEGMLTLDPSEFPKKGKESVGVARQYCGPLGKVDNCQSGVFIGYSSQKGYGLLSSQLYMPEVWFSEENAQRREDNLVPEDICFLTKQQIALNLLQDIVQTDLFPARWIGCDASFGSDKQFLKSLHENLYYFASIRSKEKVFLHKPSVGVAPYKGRGRPPEKVSVIDGQKPMTVSQVANSQEIEWIPVILNEGAKGPNVAKVACLRVYPCRDNLPDDDPVWLFFRRTADGQTKYAFSNAPEDIPFSELCQASIMRWPIEQCFQEGKSVVGMDHYEHRSWPAWHRHMLYVFLGLHFLLHIRLSYKKNDGFDCPPGSTIDCRNTTFEVSDYERSY